MADKWARITGDWATPATWSDDIALISIATEAPATVDFVSIGTEKAITISSAVVNTSSIYVTGTLTINANKQITVENLIIEGTLEVYGTVASSSSCWQVVTSGGHVHVKAGGIYNCLYWFNLDNTLTVDYGGTFSAQSFTVDDYGAATIAGRAFLYQLTTLTAHNSSASISVSAGGACTIYATTLGYHGYLIIYGVLYVWGTVDMSHGNIWIRSGGSMENYETITVEGGVLWIYNGGTLTNYGLLRIASVMVLESSGVFNQFGTFLRKYDSVVVTPTAIASQDVGLYPTTLLNLKPITLQVRDSSGALADIAPMHSGTPPYGDIKAYAYYNGTIIYPYSPYLAWSGYKYVGLGIYGIVADYTGVLGVAAGDVFDLYVEITVNGSIISRWYRTSYQPQLTTIQATLGTGAITAATIANGAIDNATFAEDVGTAGIADATPNRIALAVDKALVYENLDHLAKAAATLSADVTKGSIVDQMTSKDVSSYSFDRTTDSLEAIHDAEDTLAAQLVTLQASVTALGTGVVTLTAPVSADGTTLTLTRGDDYNVTTGLPIILSGTNWPTLTSGQTVTLFIRNARTLNAKVTKVATSVTGTTTQIITFYLTHAQTSALTADLTGNLQYFEIVATFTDTPHSQRTLVRGPCVVHGSIRW